MKDILSFGEMPGDPAVCGRFLHTAYERIEKGHRFYTVVDDTELVHGCVWRVETACGEKPV